MKKNILIVSTSLRQGGNSDLLADSFAKGALESGHNVETVSLVGKTIGFCKGCLSCQKTQHCIIQDDANAIVEKMIKSHVLVFATPVYFYDMCGQMKTLLDRSNPAFPADYAFSDIYLLASAADESAETVNGTVTGLTGWIDCFEMASLTGVVSALGVTEKGDINQTPKALEEAYAMGKAV